MSRVFDDITLTKIENKILLDWVVDQGNDPYENPWDMVDDYGTPYPFIEAVRILAGLYDGKINRFIRLNLAPLKITNDEKKALVAWIKSGNSYYQNPWFIVQENGAPYTYIEALRLYRIMKIRQ